MGVIKMFGIFFFIESQYFHAVTLIVQNEMPLLSELKKSWHPVQHP